MLLIPFCFSGDRDPVARSLQERSMKAGSAAETLQGTYV
jgi:hypothetical protein